MLDIKREKETNTDTKDLKSLRLKNLAPFSAEFKSFFISLLPFIFYDRIFSLKKQFLLPIHRLKKYIKY
jgi:hypothetical protein